MKHLTRAGGLLLVVLIVVFVVPRVMPVPASVEEFGFYPKQNEQNAQEWASRPLQYADPALCGDCHQDKHDVWEKEKHSTVSCENCHGPALAHVEEQVKPFVDVSREACGVCHNRVIARRSDFPQVDVGEHGGQATCATCHDPHTPRIGGAPAAPADTPPAAVPPPASRADSGIATLPGIPHALEGRADCLLCHNAGGIKPFPGDHDGRGQDACLNCHRSE